MQNEAIASRYAKALLDIAAAQSKVDAFTKDLESFLGVFKTSAELQVALTNPAISLEERHALMNALLKKQKVDPMVANFLRLLLDRGRMGIFPAICTAFRGQSDEAAGRARGRVYSAHKLGTMQLGKLQKAVEKLVGRKAVLEAHEDASLIGGIRVEIEGRVYDGSVRAQLERLRSQLLN